MSAAFVSRMAVPSMTINGVNGQIERFLSDSQRLMVASEKGYSPVYIHSDLMP